MKTTLLLKRMDLALQLLCTIGPFIYAWHEQQVVKIMWIYPYLGICQFISVVVNKYGLDGHLKNTGRNNYEKVLSIIIIASVLVGIVAFPLLAVLFLITPFLAMWYITMTYRETTYIGRLVHRKDFV